MSPDVLDFLWWALGGLAIFVVLIVVADGYEMSRLDREMKGHDHATPADRLDRHRGVR